ncbi:translation elongation factor [Natroniella acetigena]|uniref:type II restriction enzyme n=1 Tax=Natroniella acetigena TaxID=52004 RepID=UPI00200B0755|nr:translation elongation factor [Natroniella acetigena]MCK8826921.1 translation elongation factor [Natroniella acetigena]
MAKNRNRKVDKKWAEIFADYPIVEQVEEQGYFTITSSEINKYREARLMTKFDHESNLPYLFSEHNLTILPITRGEYIIGKFDVYEKLNLNYEEITPIEVDFPDWIESVNPKDLYSEAAVLKSALISGIINDLIESEELISTVSGRMSTNNFKFSIRNKEKELYHQIRVENSQCEIDGGYETTDKLILIEAKNSFSEDFLIRQLYYPYRLWNKKIAKEVVPVFMFYSNDIFSFFVYQFKEHNNYNSLELLVQKNYVIKDKSITSRDLEQLFRDVTIKPEPEIPFPQADSFNRVLDLVKSLYEKPLSIEEISTRYDFDKRQAQYYSRAGMYLDLIKSEDSRLKLSKLGRKIITMRRKKKNLRIVESILEHEIFYKVFKLCLKRSTLISKKDVVDIMLANKEKLYNISSESTIRRRAQTVLKWIEWILDLKG